jgi:hypothetical protein
MKIYEIITEDGGIGGISAGGFATSVMPMGMPAPQSNKKRNKRTRKESSDNLMMRRIPKNIAEKQEGKNEQTKSW